MARTIFKGGTVMMNSLWGKSISSAQISKILIANSGASSQGLRGIHLDAKFRTKKDNKEVVCRDEGHVD